MKCIFSTRTSWSLRNINFSIRNASFPIYIDFSVFYHRQDFYRIWLWITRRESYKKQKLLNFCEYLGLSPDFYEVRIAHSFSFLRCVFCFVCLCSVFRVACFPYLWIVNSWLSHHFSTTFILLNVLFLNHIMLKIFCE